MANSCIMISALPDKYKEWIQSTSKELTKKGVNHTEAQLEKIWLDRISEQDASGLMAYIHNPDRGARTALQFNGSSPKETLVLGLKDNENGSVTVATIDGVYTFKDGSDISVPTSNSGVRVEMPIMKDIKKQAEAFSISGFSNPFNVMSSKANAWASEYLLIGLANKSGSIIGPLIDKAHTAAKKKSNLYRDTVNLIDKGMRDSVFLGKLKVALKITGDIDDKALADTITLSYNSARHTKEVLDTALPALDKRINREVRNPEDRVKLNDIFGRSGFMHLLDNSSIIAEINKGTTLEKLFEMIPHTKQQLSEAQELSNYYMKGEVGVRGLYNSESTTVTQLAALISLKEDGRWDVLEKTRTKNPELYVELLRLSGMVKSLHDVVYYGKRNTVGVGSGKVYQGFDGYGMLDVYDGSHEYRFVNDKTMAKTMEDPRWKVIRQPSKGVDGILYRESLNNFQDGIGLNKDTIRNGISVDSAYVKEMIKEHGDRWLKDNNVIRDIDNGYERYRIVLKIDEKKIAGYKDNIAHTLYRTWVHNAELTEMQTVQDIVMQNMVANGEQGLSAMEAGIIRNAKVSSNVKKTEIKPFIQTDIPYEELKTKYPEVYKKYTPVKNISNYGDMREKISLVRKDMEDVLIGYNIGSIFKDDSTFGVSLQRIETVYKQLVQMVKIKMVPANPPKLAMDMISNTTLLMSMDVGIEEIAKGYPEAVMLWKSMSDLESKLVSAKLELAKAEAMKEDLTKHQKKVNFIAKQIENHPFYPAIKNGFIQSQGTSMLVKDYDTITGLQKSIDDLIGSILKDKKGNPNTAHYAVVKMMNFGFGVDDIINSISNMSKIKGTSFGEELQGIADRLSEKKAKDIIKAEEKRLGRKLTESELREVNGEADTVRYISEFIAAPSSEIVRQGSRAMQLADVMSRWTLYKHEITKVLAKKGYKFTTAVNALIDIKSGVLKITEEDFKEIESAAALKALDTFIDYRINLPKELKTLSSLGVIMFPEFWLKAQKVIFNLVKYHPINAGAGIVLTDILNLNGASIIDANIFNKIYQGTLVQAGQSVLSVGTIIPGL